MFTTRKPSITCTMIVPLTSPTQSLTRSLVFRPLYSILAELDNWTLPDWATSAFQRRLHLISPSSFPRYSSASESKLKSLSGQTSFTLPGSASPKSNHKLTEDELKLALHAASKFDLDASEALVLVRSFKVWLRGPKAWTEEDAELDLEDMDSFQIFYFDERLAVIHLLRAISSTSQCKRHSSCPVLILNHAKTTIQNYPMLFATSTSP